jgi:hypothetical protein
MSRSLSTDEIAQLGSAFREFGTGVESTIASELVGDDAAAFLASAVEHARQAAVASFVSWLRLRAMQLAMGRAKEGR